VVGVGGNGGSSSSSNSTGSTVVVVIVVVVVVVVVVAAVVVIVVLVVVVVVVVSVAAVFYTSEALHLGTNSFYVLGLFHHHPSPVSPTDPFWPRLIVSSEVFQKAFVHLLFHISALFLASYCCSFLLHVVTFS